MEALPKLQLPPGLRPDVNLSILFTDLPLLDRPAAAAAAGFEAVELWWPFDRSVPPPAAVDRLVDAIGAAGLTLACLNLPSGDFSEGERGLVSLPDRRTELLDGAAVALEIASRLHCRKLNALYGNQRPDVATDAQDEDAEAALAELSGAAAHIDAAIVLEALNALEYPQYGIHAVDRAAALAARVASEGAGEIAVLFDAYHVERGEGDVVARFLRVAPRVGHLQIADVPGRGRPGSGSLPFARLFEAVESSGYAGFVGLEYRPSADADDTFAWLRPPQS